MAISHNPIKSSPPAADMLVAVTTSKPLRGFPAAKPLGRSLTGTFCPAFEKAGQNKGAAPIEKHV